MRNFKKTLCAVLVVAASLGVFWALDFLLYPCTFMRNDLHAICTETFDDLYVGTSHGKLNIDPEAAREINGRTGHNLCVGGEYSIDVYHMLRLAIEQGHAPSRVIYEISPAYFTLEKEEGNNYLLFYHEFPLSFAKWEYFWNAVAKCDLRALLFPWYEYDLSYELENIGKTVQKKWEKDYGTEDFRTETQTYYESGFVGRNPVDTSTFRFDGIQPFEREKLRAEHLEYLEKTIALCKEKGIAFVAVTTPVPTETLRAYMDSYTDADAFFGDFFAKQEVPYLNFNNQTYFKYASHNLESYTDLDGHMHTEAAREFTKNLAKLMERKEGQPS